MSSKRLLLIHSDPFLAHFYRDKLGAAKFQVEVAPTVAAGLDALSAQRADLLIFDPMLTVDLMPEPIKEMRSNALIGQMPIISLFTPHYVLAEAIRKSGNAHLLTSQSNPLGEALKVSAEILGIGPLDSGTLMQTLPDENWKEKALEAARYSLSTLRRQLHELARPNADPSLLRGLLQTVHHFTGQTSLLQRTALNHIANAVEVLIFTLQQAPGRMDVLALRTLGQAVDFLDSLLDGNTYSHVPDFGGAQIMVIEDEASARELIIAAMELVGLHASGSSTPKTGLAYLGNQACDLIFLDINLPEMNGFEVCNKVRAMPLHERTPIVFLTGMNSFHNRVQSSLSGGNDFVGKPFNVAELGVKALMWVMKGRLGLN